MVYLFKWKWTWTIWIWVLAFTTIFPLIEVLPVAFEMLGFFTILSLVFTGALPLFDTENIKYHNTFGIMTGILSQICVTIICPYWLFLWVLMFLIILWEVV